MRYTFLMSARDFLVIIVFVLLFLGLRLRHFSQVLNFSTDQATFSLRALEIWRNQEVTLVGPTASFNVNGRYLIQSSVIYYTTLLFMLAGGFDPVRACQLFVVLASIGVPLMYIGTRKLAGRRVAAVVTLIYVCSPVYLRHTQFLWNPNYQLALTPTLVFLYSGCQAARQRKDSVARWWLFATGFLVGWMALYHYQFVPVVGGALVYLLIKRPRHWLLALVGMVAGLSPLLAFELRSHFYLTQTVWLLLTDREGGGALASLPRGIPAHYVTSLSLVSLVAIAVNLRRVLQRLLSVPVLVGVMAGLVAVGLSVVWRVPEQAYGMAPHWSYLGEKQAYEQIATVVQERQLHNYAVANTLYDTLAPVTYFLLARDGVPGATRDYRSNDFLFVISAADGSSLVENPAYEIADFSPIASVEQWELSDQYALFLLERGHQESVDQK